MRLSQKPALIAQIRWLDSNHHPGDRQGGARHSKHSSGVGGGERTAALCPRARQRVLSPRQRFGGAVLFGQNGFDVGVLQEPVRDGKVRPAADEVSDAIGRRYGQFSMLQKCESPALDGALCWDFLLLPGDTQRVLIAL